MKFRDKFGNDVDCSVEEYRSLMSGGVVSDDSDEDDVVVDRRLPVEKMNRKPIVVVPVMEKVSVKSRFSHGKPKKWSRDDSRLLREHWVNGSWDKLLKLFPDRSEGQISRRAYKMHLPHRKFKFNFWTDDDLKVLRDNASNSSRCKELLSKRHSISSVGVYLTRLKHGTLPVKKSVVNSNDRYSYYSDSDLKVLRQHNSDVDKCVALLPNHSRGSIVNKLHKLDIFVTAKPSKPKVVVVASKGVRSRFSDSDVRLLRDNRHDVDRCVELLPSHTRGSIIFKLQKLGLYVHVNEQGSSVKKVHGGSARMRFMGSRCAYYMRSYNWSREQAMVQASQDWKSGKLLGTVSSSVPVFDFQVVKFDFDTQKYVIVDTKSDELEAKRLLDELKAGEATVGGKAQFSIVKVRR